MRLSDKHNNTTTLTFANFSGGLNSTTAQEMISDNELSRCLNMDIDTQSGLLKVVDGNKNIFTPPDGTKIKSVFYDIINRIWLVVDTNNAAYTIDLTADKPAFSATLGTLTGTLFPCYASWESGLLIASGGKLQYYNGTALVALENSKDHCSAVYVKTGRVVTNDLTAENQSNIYFSATGDETTWADTSGDDSTGKWTEVGYKDGGKVIAFVPMSQDMLIIKNNKCVYRLTGDYPNWAVVEVSRNVDCISPHAFYPEGTSVYIVGNNRMQLLDTNNFYGDIKASDIAAKVSDKLKTIDAGNPRMIYVPPLNQVWIPLEQRFVLVYDCTAKAFFMRRFVGEGIVDVVSVGTTIFIIRPSSICKVVSNLGYDNGKKMMWSFASKRLISPHDFLLKRASVNITPHFDTLIEGNFKIGGIMFPLPTPYVAFRVWHNYSRIYHNRRHVMGANERCYNLYDAGAEVYENFEPVYHNYSPVCNPAAISMGDRCVYRNKTMAVSGSGSGCCFLLNNLTLDVAEV